MEFFLIANKVKEADLKHATLLSVIGPHTFKLLQNLLTPDKLGDKSHAKLVKALTEQFSSKLSENVQRSKRSNYGQSEVIWEYNGGANW